MPVFSISWYNRANNLIGWYIIIRKIGAPNYKYNLVADRVVDVYCALGLIQNFKIKK